VPVTSKHKFTGLQQEVHLAKNGIDGGEGTGNPNALASNWIVSVD